MCGAAPVRMRDLSSCPSTSPDPTDLVFNRPMLAHGVQEDPWVRLSLTGDWSPRRRFPGGPAPFSRSSSYVRGQRLAGCTEHRGRRSGPSWLARTLPRSDSRRLDFLGYRLHRSALTFLVLTRRLSDAFSSTLTTEAVVPQPLEVVRWLRLHSATEGPSLILNATS